MGEDSRGADPRGYNDQQLASSAWLTVRFDICLTAVAHPHPRTKCYKMFPRGRYSLQSSVSQMRRTTEAGVTQDRLAAVELVGGWD